MLQSNTPSKGVNSNNQSYMNRLFRTYIHAQHNTSENDVELDNVLKLSSPEREKDFVQFALFRCIGK